MDTTEKRPATNTVDTRRLLDHLQVGLVIFTAAGHIIDMNRYARRMLKRDGPCEGLLIDEALHEAIMAEVPNLYGRMERALTRSAKQTVAIPTPEGTRHWEVTVSHSAAEGVRDVIVMMLDDVTELVAFERLQRRTERLERMNTAVLEANRLKTEFLANMSHELRTPLNSIIGFAELMASGRVGAPDPRHQEFLGDILTSARHLLQIINDVLDLSKVEAGKLDFSPQRVETTELVREVTGILREQAARKRVRFVETIAPDATDAILDPLRTKQILYNYLSNAVKFTDPGDEVAVRVAHRGGRIRFEVEDHGPGIDEDDHLRLFVEFQQLDQGSGKNHQGTGLGLALTKRLAEAQGGAVGVQSRPGAGSLFWVELPQGDAAKRALEETATSRTLDQYDATARVLVVEDDDQQRAQIIAALDAEGYATETASTVQEATEKVRTGRFDAITLDLLLPDGHGMDVLNALRAENLHHTPVIVASVSEPTGSMLAFPVIDYLAKPFDPSVIVAALRRLGVPPDRPVLVVDDDDAIQRLVAHQLQSLGYRVQTSGSGEDALTAAHVDPPGLVVLDLLMPGMDGFEFLERFRATPAGSDVPVIVWTTKDLSRAEREYLQKAAQRVLQKGEGGTHSLVATLKSAIRPPRRVPPAAPDLQVVP